MGNTDSTLNSSHSKTSLYDSRFTAQGYRTLRRSQLIRRALVLHQVCRGRANPSEVWCNDKNCDEELGIFSNPVLHLTDLPTSHEGLPVAVYSKDFAHAVIAKFFDIQDINKKKHKVQGLLSFIDSPPVRTAFWHFIVEYDKRMYRLSDEDFQKALVKAQAGFLDIMFGIKTAARAQLVHSYIRLEPEVQDKWDLQQLILRFLVCSEIWRQQKTPRSENWKIGSREGVGHFMTAMLFHFKLMWQQNCFDTDFIRTNHVWDRVWDLWLRKYPLRDPDEVIDGDVFQLHDHIENTEQEVLDEVGYLGGIGQNNDTYNPVHWYPGKEEYLAK